MALQKVNYEAQTDSFWVNMSPNELKLIAALLYSFRLGVGNSFKDAAMELMNGIDMGAPADFAEEAADEVGIYVTLEDADGNVAAEIDSPYMTIEVKGGFAQPLLTAP